jgi:hypothetical protein
MYGFEAKTDSGKILASSEYFSFHALNGVTFNTTIATQGVVFYEYYVYYPFSQPPLVMIDLDVNDTASVSFFRQVGSNWYFRVLGTAKTTLSKILAFGKLVSPSGNYGLNVLNGSGELTFSATSKPLWITNYYYNPGATTLSSPNADQISGTYTNTNPIFMCNIIYSIFNPSNGFTQIGIKRTGTNSWSTWLVENGAFGSGTFRNIGVIVADYVV